MKLIKDVVANLEKKCTNIPLLFKLYALPYKGIVKKEVKLANITKNDRVLNIGCGAMPFTAVYIAQLTGAEVYALDYDGGAVKRAKKCIKRLGLDKQITVKQGDGRFYSAANFAAVVVALQAEPKEEILKNLYKTADGKTNFIFRQARKHFAKQYDILPDKYQADDLVRQWMLTFNRSELFIKRRIR